MEKIYRQKLVLLQVSNEQKVNTFIGNFAKTSFELKRIFDCHDFLDLKCNIDFKDENEMDCKSYKSNAYCTKQGEEGSGWNQNIFGSIAKYYNKNNETPLVCPQCGCKLGNDIELTNHHHECIHTKI